MMSRLMTLLKILGPRSATTANHPNSWAVVSLWRQLFAQKKEEEEQALDILCEILGIDVTRIRPISEASNSQLLQEFTRDGHRINAGQSLLYSTSFPMNYPTTSRDSEETVSQVRREAQQLHSPNLSIPDGEDNYLTRAQ